MVEKNRSLSFALILNSDEPDIFSVVVTDKSRDLMVDITNDYEASTVRLKDGRLGVIMVAKLPEGREEEEPAQHINPFDRPGQENT